MWEIFSMKNILFIGQNHIFQVGNLAKNHITEDFRGKKWPRFAIYFNEKKFRIAIFL